MKKKYRDYKRDYKKANLSNPIIWSLSIIALIVGILYYLLVRDPILASKWFGVTALHQHLTGFKIDWLPSFVHQFAFSLLTWLALDRSYRAFSVLFWLGVNLLFEIGQTFSKADCPWLPEMVQNYCQKGTFGYDDIIALVIAAIVAYAIMIYQNKRSIQ